MEPSCSRFTPPEGGARLAHTTRDKNLIVTDHTTFIALRLLHEEGYSIRGALRDGKKRSVYVTRGPRVECTAYDVNLLTDLSVVSAINYHDVVEWPAELEKKEVVVCTSAVIRRILEEGLLSMISINVLIIDSCHLICKDDNLRYIMHLYKETSEPNRPRILALTYPLLDQKPVEPPNDTESETCKAEKTNNDTRNENDDSRNENDDSRNENDDFRNENDDSTNENVNSKNEIDNSSNENSCLISENDISKCETTSKNYEIDSRVSVNLSDNNKISKYPEINNDINKKININISVIGSKTEIKNESVSDNCTAKGKNDTEKTKCSIDIKTDYDNVKNDIDNVGNENDTIKKPVPIGAYENMDDFDMYEKLEWKIDVLENELCCEADLAEDIDGIKRLQPAVKKPRELIVEFTAPKHPSLLPKVYSELETYMRASVNDVMCFLEDHRYDPMEIYGEDLYDELIKIPDPTIDPKRVLLQFLYVLDELGPYAADKAAFALLATLEKLRIKVPYERHFLLLCICTSVFVKIRCYADLVFSKFESDWEKIQRFSTPKLLRFVEILEKFKPADLNSRNDNDTKDRNDNDTKDRNENDTFVGSTEMIKTIDRCDFVSLGNVIEDKINEYEANLKEIDGSNIIDGDNKHFDTELNKTQSNSSNFYKIKSENETDICKNDTSKDENDTKINANDTIKNEIVTTKNENDTTNESCITKSENYITNKNDISKNDSDTINENDITKSENDTTKNQDDNAQKLDASRKVDSNSQKNTILGFPRRHGHRLRGRGRSVRSHAMKSQQSQHPDALCGIVFVKEPFMAKILFNLIVDVSRSHPALDFLSAQYSAIESVADPAKEPREFENQRKKQEDVLKKFRMHDCNLLLATALLEEGIDLPRCNLVLRWDVPTCYRSHSLCKSRARAARASCLVLERGRAGTTSAVLHYLATYTQIDQIISRKCGCGIQDEPNQCEEDFADDFTQCVQPYTTQTHTKLSNENYMEKSGDKSLREYEKNEESEKSFREFEKNEESEKSLREFEKNEESENSLREFEINEESEKSLRKFENNEESEKSLREFENNEESEKSLRKFENNEESEKSLREFENNEESEKSLRQCENIDNDNGSHINESEINIINRRYINEEPCISPNTKTNTDITNTVLNKEEIVENDIVNCESQAVINKLSNKSDIKRPNSKNDMIVNENDKGVVDIENVGASVDLGSAVALINRYCGKLPSDTFTRLAPQWWLEEVQLPLRGAAGQLKEAYICTLRLPLNCPVKFNIVGHPMPTRVLAKRMVALQAARILHQSGELDNNLMPISKENFQSVELDIGAPPPSETADSLEPSDLARPGTTKRRQYYYKKTARAFTNCEPQINATDEEILKPFNPSMLSDTTSGGGRANTLCSVVCVLQCALPERYNTRGRALHAPQHSAPGLALLYHAATHRMNIPQFPVYTRSGEVRVSLKQVPDADTRLSPHRQTRILRFMRFVFSDVLRVRRKGMRLDPKGCTHNNYYIVPTIKSTREDGSTKIDIDWDFLEVIYKYTEDRHLNNLSKNTPWQHATSYDDDSDDDYYKNGNENNSQSDIVNQNENDSNESKSQNDTHSLRQNDKCQVGVYSESFKESNRNETNIQSQNEHDNSRYDTNQSDVHNKNDNVYHFKESEIDESTQSDESDMKTLKEHKKSKTMQNCYSKTDELEFDTSSESKILENLKCNEEGNIKHVSLEFNAKSIRESETDDKKNDTVKSQNENDNSQNDNDNFQNKNDNSPNKKENFQNETENSPNKNAKSQNDDINSQNENDNSQNENDNSQNQKDNFESCNSKKVVKKMNNPFLKPGEVFVFNAANYKEAVVTPWYRNQDQPQFFLVAEICWGLSPESAFPSATHASFRSYYLEKYGVELTQPNQPLLDVDHTSARLNLLTPRYVNRKGVALPVSSERTRRAKRDRLDQKQILLPELCHTHPFPAPLWFATVALPAILYRVNALLIADEIRSTVAREAALGVPEVTDPHFEWPPLHFGWSLEEVLNADTEKYESRTEQNKNSEGADDMLGKEESESMEKHPDTQKESNEEGIVAERTINDILQEKERPESGFEIGTWSNAMASAIPDVTEYDEMTEPLPSDFTFCTSASGGTNWCNTAVKKKSNLTPPGKTFSMADSDCSYMSSCSDFDTDDTDLNSAPSDDEESSGFGSARYTNALGVRIEYKTAHEAEAVDLESKKPVKLGPRPSLWDDYVDRCEQDDYMHGGRVPEEYKRKFHASVEKHKIDIEQHCIVKQDEVIVDILPPSPTHTRNKQTKHDNEEKKTLLNQLFPYGTTEAGELINANEITLDVLEKNKKILMAELKKTLPDDEIKKMNCFSMIDVSEATVKVIDDSLRKVSTKEPSNRDDFPMNENVNCNSDRLGNKGFGSEEFKPYYQDDCGLGGKTFDFDYQPDLEGHPGPSPSLILQALTMSNANDGINLERLETIGDSFLKLAITSRLYCAHPTVHEGKLSHMRSKQVSNLNLYRLGRNKNLGNLMIASKFEPHDNWLPPCHKAPKAADFTSQVESQDHTNASGAPVSHEGCFIPYNLITQHSIPDKSIADCVEALIGAYLVASGARGALLFMCWLGLNVLPPLQDQKSSEKVLQEKSLRVSKSGSYCGSEYPDSERRDDTDRSDAKTNLNKALYGELRPPPSPLLRYIADPEGELEKMLSGYEVLEETLQYRFRDRSLLLQAMTHASHQTNRLTDCYQRLEFLGDAILDYLITRHLFMDARRHSPGALTDLRSALVNNTIFATLAVRHHFHKFFRHMSPGLNEVLTKYVKIQEENGHSISEEHYLIQEDEMEQAEDVEVPKALGDLFESVAGAIFLDSGMSLSAVWRSYERLMRLELEAFSAAAPKSPVRELLEQEPDTAKFGKPERLADGRRVRVKVEVFGRGTFKGIGRNYRIAKGTAARCALRHLKTYNK